MAKYDYLVVGAGLYGAVFAHEARKAGKSVMVIDRRPNIAGNVYTEDVEGIRAILVHMDALYLLRIYISCNIRSSLHNKNRLASGIRFMRKHRSI